MTKLLAAALMLLCLLVSPYAFGQTSNATLGGTVSDATGALIPGVTVTATNTGTGIVTTQLTNEAGAYQFASLQPGTYTLTADLPGFQTQTYNAVALGGAQQVRLNFALQVGSVAQNVEVTVAADTLIATTSSSVGTVLPEYKVRDLPLGGRNVLDLVSQTAGGGPDNAGSNGVDGYFAGQRLSAVNTTRDGFVVSDGRYDFGAFANTYTSPDLVEEVRVITASVDAEATRGSGQVQMVTRSGTNQFRGSVFWNNRNSALDASNWFNNFNGVDKDYINRNQFGARVGGPIIKNKTFFFALLDEQRYISRQTFVGPVLTAQARQGIYRFFPGADNQNLTANNPTVDRNGNPVRPATATGDLQQISVFTRADGTARDLNRPGYDPTGFIQNTLLSRMPLPNDYTIGDGLNTAGIRFARRIDGFDFQNGESFESTNRDQFNARIDHNFNSNHKTSLVYTWERDNAMTAQAGIMQWPGGYNGTFKKTPKLITGSLVSTLASSVVSEARVGYKLSTIYVTAPIWVDREGQGEPAGKGKEAFSFVPIRNGIPLLVGTTLFPQNFMNWPLGDSNTRGGESPLYSFADTLSWNQGRHAFKLGGEVRIGKSLSWNDTHLTPLATLGAGGVPVANIDNAAIPGLTGNNQTVARNLLTDLSGSIATIQQGFDIADSKNLVFQGYADGVRLKYREYHSNEFSGFFKDTWKIRPALTLNLGIHYEWFNVPYETHGLVGMPVGAEQGLCGISCGALTRVEFVGKNSPNPDKKLYKDDWNNFAPSLGFSWSLPWFGQDKTVLRAGYGWAYTSNTLKGVVGGINAVAGSIPGAFAGFGATGLTYTQAEFLSLANATLPIPQQYPPLRPSPLDGSRADSLQMYSSDRVNPYIQNFNVGLQREVASDLLLDVSYVGSKGTRLFGGIPLNNDEIFANGFLEAFKITREGGNAALFDTMLRGLTIPGAGVVGSTVTGSAALRTFTSTRTFIANGSVGQLADFLNRNTAVTNTGGGFVRNSGAFPENFFVLNPQFNNVILNANPSSSTYHSLQVQVTKRLSHGFTSASAYTWSRALGDNDADAAITYIDPRNKRLNKALLGFHRTHLFTSNGTFEMPFGPGRPLLSNAPGWIQRLVERWQIGGLFSYSSGAPLNIVAPIATITQAGTTATSSTSTPNIVGDFPKSSGQVTRVANGVTFFPGIQQVADPALALGTVSTANGLSGSFSNKAIADAQGNLLLVNPSPGQVGTLGLKWIQGPSNLGFDANLIKRVRISETKEFEFRLDAVSVLNRANFGAPDLNINSTSFGRITTATGNRKFIINARLNF